MKTVIAILNDTHIGGKQTLDAPISKNLKATVDWLLALEKQPAAVFIMVISL